MTERGLLSWSTEGECLVDCSLVGVFVIFPVFVGLVVCVCVCNIPRICTTILGFFYEGENALTCRLGYQATSVTRDTSDFTNILTIKPL